MSAAQQVHQDGASSSSSTSTKYSRPWWALRATTVYRGAKSVYKYSTSFPGTYCLARFGERTAEGALQLTGVKERLQLEEPASAATSKSYKRTPNIKSIDYSVDKSLDNVDRWIDGRLADPSTIEGQLVRVSTSWGSWMVRQLPFGSHISPVIDDLNPDATATETGPATSVPAAAAAPVEAAPSSASAVAPAAELPVATLTDDVETVETEVADPESTTDAPAAGADEISSDRDGTVSLSNAVSSSSLASMDDSIAADAVKRVGKKPKGKARRLLRSMGNSFKKAINFPKSPHTAPYDDAQETSTSGTTTFTAPTPKDVTQQQVAVEGSN